MPKSITFKYSKPFLKDVARLSPSQTDRLAQRLELFRTNPAHPLLRYHELKGKLRGRFTINITGDIWAIYRILTGEKSRMTVEFLRLGTHSELY